MDGWTDIWSGEVNLELASLKVLVSNWLLLNSCFTISRVLNAHKTVYTDSIQSSVSCPLLPSLMNKIPRSLNSFTKDRLSLLTSKEQCTNFWESTMAWSTPTLKALILSQGCGHNLTSLTRRNSTVVHSSGPDAPYSCATSFSISHSIRLYTFFKSIKHM